MRFDDRLQTVLSQAAENHHDVAVRWRQLVDLVARAGANSGSGVVAEALEVIRRDAPQIEEPVRAAAARAIAALPLPLGLLEYFASGDLAVSAPVLAAASLDPRQWSVLRNIADEETRLFIDTLHPELGGHALAGTQAPHAPVSAAAEDSIAETSYTPPSLHEVVARIERRRHARVTSQDSPPPQNPTEPPPLFRWECGPSGEIAWVEGAPRGALIGRSINRAAQSDGDRVDQRVVRAFETRAPFRDGQLQLTSAGPLAGEWRISGVPAFEAADGRFAGYRGVALREVHGRDAPPPPLQPTNLLPDPDSVRELVHEIKTPLNAIIGFAEMIEGQYLGPADRGYRERASEICGQARLLLTAIDDLDYAARIHSAGGVRQHVDLAAMLDRMADELRAAAERKGLTVEVPRSRFEVPARVQPALADRLVRRLFTALVDFADAGDKLQVSVELSADRAGIAMRRPHAKRGASDADLLEGAPSDQLRHGAFTLRLLRGLARIAGGDLVTTRESFSLVFPRA